MRNALHAISILVALAAAVPGAAQSQQDYPQEPRERARTARRGTAPSAQERQFTGRIADLRRIRLAREREPHMLAKVRLQDGRTIVVDLGSVEMLERAGAEVRRNQEITVWGTSGRVNRRPVIIAYRVQPAGERGQLQVREERTRERRMRERRTGELTARRQVQPGRIAFTGSVLDVRQVQLRGERQRHQLLKLDTEARGTVVVDAGPGASLEELSLQRGDRLVVTGIPGRINDKPVIYAAKVAKVVEVQRPEQTRTRERQQTRETRTRAQRSREVVRGTVENVQRVQIEGDRERQTLVQLRLEDGRSRIVNLGPRVDPSELDLRRNDRIVVRGRPTSINGRTVIRADELSIEGERIQLEDVRSRGTRERQPRQ